MCVGGGGGVEEFNAIRIKHCVKINNFLLLNVCKIAKDYIPMEQIEAFEAKDNLM